MNPIALHAFNPTSMTGTGNWTWLLPGRVPTLIDAGVGDPRHLATLEEALAGETNAQVVVTHGHFDHASGAAAIARRLEQVRFLKKPWPERDVRWPVPWTRLADGDLIEAGDTHLLTIHTPGHAADHLCFWHAQSRTLFGGDLAIEGSTVYIPSSVDGDLAAYLASIERVLALDPARILPAHGPVIENPASLLRAYLRHRRQREGQIVGILRESESTSDAIVRRLYGGLHDELFARARDMVEAHLLKLERDGRAIRVGDRWRTI